jgi:hypothetical protein
MWKNSLKNIKSDNSKILYETLLDLFLQRNGTYFLDKPCIYVYTISTFISFYSVSGEDPTMT